MDDPTAREVADREAAILAGARRQPRTCSSEDCERGATEWLMLRDQPGHVHDCPEHAHDVREWCDVTDSGPMSDDATCPLPVCTQGFIFHGQPTPLEESW